MIVLFTIQLNAKTTYSESPLLQDKLNTEEYSSKRNWSFGAELGLFNGLYGRYDFNSRFAVSGQLGMNYDVAYTVPRKFYRNGLTPALYITGQYFVYRPKHYTENHGLYLGLGLFGDLGRYAVLKPSYENRLDYGGEQSAGVFIKLGFTFPVYEKVSIKGGILLNEGVVKMRGKDYDGDQVQARNEFLFNLGVCIPF